MKREQAKVEEKAENHPPHRLSGLRRRINATTSLYPASPPTLSFLLLFVTISHCLVSQRIKYDIKKRLWSVRFTHRPSSILNLRIQFALWMVKRTTYNRNIAKYRNISVIVKRNKKKLNQTVKKIFYRKVVCTGDICKPVERARRELSRSKEIRYKICTTFL